MIFFSNIHAKSTSRESRVAISDQSSSLVSLNLTFKTQLCPRPPRKDLVFYGHHVLTAVCCLSFLVTGRGHLWCCWLGLVEGTNPALNMLTILGQIPGQKGGEYHSCAVLRRLSTSNHTLDD